MNKSNKFSSKKIQIFSPSKINLFLDVVGKRKDGYHLLNTIFAKLNFGDNIEIFAQPADKINIEIKIFGAQKNKLSNDENNLVYKAAKKFLEKFKISAEIKINLEKNIPIGGGLGGGSSNAACVLKALAKLFDKQTLKDFETIKNLAAELGADCALFIYDETFLKGEGVGEILTPIKNGFENKKDSPYIVLTYPGFEISTKEAYEKLAVLGEQNLEKTLTTEKNINKIIRYINRGDYSDSWKTLMYNKFELCAISINKEIQTIKEYYENSGAKNVLMSGSGSCVFALVENKTKAERIAKEMRDKVKRKNSLVTFTKFLDS